MKTLTLTASGAPTTVSEALDFQPSVPAFISMSSGVFSVLVRDVGHVSWEERWIDARRVGYWDEAEQATDLELEVYLATKNTELLSDIDDMPEPISVHDQEIWMECVQGEYDDFREEFADLLYA